MSDSTDSEADDSSSEEQEYETAKRSRPLPPENSDDEEDSSQEFEILEIMNERSTTNKGKEVQVKWVGHEKKKAWTWEPVERFKTLEVYAAFGQKRRDERARSRKRERTGNSTRAKKKRKKVARAVEIVSSESESESNEETEDEEEEEAEKAESENESEKEAESDSDLDDAELTVQNKRKRKKIRKIQDKQTDAEKKALEKEEARKKRLAERNAGATEDSPTKRKSEVSEIATPEHRSEICLNPKHKSDELPIYACDSVGSKLQQHQIDGVRFMFDNVVESAEMARNKDNEGMGCILAHFMGLGKTLQCITLIEAFLSYKIGRHVLVVVPVNVVHNWKQEFQKWLPEERRPNITVVYKSNYKERVRWLKEWEKNGGVLIIGYEMFRNLIKGKRMPKNLQKQATKVLTEVPDILFIDEGHRIKNVKTGLSKVLNSVVSRRRIVLTGTPLQNNLTEYYCMVNFVRPNFLGDEMQFNNRFKNPITNGQCADSSEEDMKLMKERVFILHKKLSGFVHRRDYSHMKNMLPGKREFVVFCRLTAIQKKLYKTYLKNLNSERAGLFQCYHWLMKVWNHPDSLLYFERDVEENLSSDEDETDGDLEGFIVGDDTESETEHDSDGDPVTTKILKKKRKRDEKDEAAKAPPAKRRKINNIWWRDLIDASNGYEEGKMEHSSKVMIAYRIVRLAIKRKEKVLIFSQSLFLLDFLERVFDDKLEWELGTDYMRLDGSTAGKQRQDDIDHFNSETSSPPWVYLISTKAGSLGVNLHSANVVVVFDCSWNPSHDSQAIFRSYRQGQKKNVSIYRLVAAGTMENKIYQRQIVKKSLSLRVVDEKQIERFFDKQEVSQLFQLDEDMSDDEDIVEIRSVKKCKDFIMNELLKDHGSALLMEYLDPQPKKCRKECLIKDIEIPQDLLVHHDEEELTEAQQADALASFQDFVDNERYMGAFPNTIDAGKRAKPGSFDSTSFVSYQENVSCANCRQKTSVRITRQTDSTTKFDCDRCHQKFTLTLNEAQTKRIQTRLNHIQEQQERQKLMYEEIMNLDDSTVFTELHTAWEMIARNILEKVQERCPQCRKINQFDVAPGQWHISCGQCKHKFSVTVKQSKQTNQIARQQALMRVHSKFVGEKSQSTAPKVVDLTEDTEEVSGPIRTRVETAPVRRRYFPKPGPRSRTRPNLPPLEQVNKKTAVIEILSSDDEDAAKEPTKPPARKKTLAMLSLERISSDPAPVMPPPLEVDPDLADDDDSEATEPETDLTDDVDPDLSEASEKKDAPEPPPLTKTQSGSKFDAIVLD